MKIEFKNGDNVDLDVILGLSMILIYILLLIGILYAFMLVSTFIASYLNLSGIMWWAVALVSFLVLTGLAGGISITVKGN